jgi:hypothetical protein
MPKFQDYYPKVKYPGPDFLQNTSIIRNLISAIQQVTILQENTIQNTRGSSAVC